MASISLSQRPISALTEQLSNAHASNLRHNHLAVPAPLPNPPFVFPAREPDAPSTAREDESSAPPPLPAFSFNPGNGHAPTASTSAMPAHARAGGHRRRATEFNPVGGSGLGSSPPGKTDNSTGSTTLPLPGPGLSGAGPGRRGHAHRRSAAVSSMDLTAITKAFPGMPLVGSAPSTPADMKQQHDLCDEMARPTSCSVPSPRQSTPPASPAKVEEQSGSTEKLESAERPTAAPRPLSTISAETSSSLTTIRPTQTVISDASISTTKNSPNQPLRPRPKTADSSLALFQFGAGGSSENAWRRPVSAAAPPSRRASFSDIQSPNLERDNWDAANEGAGSSRASSDSDSSDTTVEDESKAKHKSHLRSKAQKRQKKVRSWAGAILTRGKGKKHHSKKSPTTKSPPPRPILVRTNSEVGSLAEVDFDEDNTVIIRTPTNPTSPRPPLPPLNTDASSLESAWKPKSFYEQNVDNDMFSPVIDLDAALGPFNTPEMSSDRVAGSSFSVATRRMYSGGRRGEFVGPEMRYHRRAESAPEMPPFDRSFLATARLAGANPAMPVPDVFYEEEEDAFLAGNQSPGGEQVPALKEVGQSDVAEKPADESSSNDTSATVTPVAADSSTSVHDQGLGIRLSVPNDGSSSHTTSSRTRDDFETRDESVKAQDDVTMSSPFARKSSVEIVPHDAYHRKFDSPDVSPRFVPADKRPDTSSADLAFNIPHLSLPGDARVNSAFPSPDPSEAPRSATASSMTDRNISHSLYSNDPQVEYPHGSVEDVPSLTSSTSTMTSNLPRFSTTFNFRPGGERAASYSAPVPRRTSRSNATKRSSLASLSKLVVGSHGEKSKLSYEMKASGDETEKLKKKGHRISRLMHFWKIREKDKHRTNGD
ncbi:hypothetical protein DTO021D3_6334 [Paecilomyces variotii]|nr:hypothetical protein DTO032I3_8651 [Paecilomyces variotii]KAJ9276729.1 hypothetical protein DTO021D3_6334 [Paecilomyces variotii]KAJ9345767.1 hypothetical protein DTO027B6_1727 [Paecilomyces variotii]KAJ9387385.1 hypothetical protein DTO032I4_3249 [Paecilomyces variotii]